MSLPLADAIELFCDMEEFVKSLDRIRSRIAFGGADPQILVDYIVDREVFQRLAKARRRLIELVEPVIGAEQLEEIAEGVYAYPGESSSAQ
ncbi:hypothetical protein ACIBCN_17240 [Nocardia sp. NPDC051052]|uniref:hypothetical protein n=1 Tax=Nocardia sp. NPDC051052 TaxID=3364322 RepID=UPI0037996984